MSEYALPSVIRGTRAPEALRVVVSAGTSGIDMTTVTAAELRVHGMPRRAEQVWYCAIATATASTLTLDHEFDAIGDELSAAGVLRLLAVLTIPTGEVRAGPFSLAVVEW